MQVVSSKKPPENPPADRGLEALRVGHLKYAVHFLLFFVLLTLVGIRVEKKSDYGLSRVERLYRGGSPLFAADPSASHGNLQLLAADLKVPPEDLQASQFVVEEFMNQLEREQPLSPSRMIILFDGEYYRYYIGWEVFANALFAWFFAMYFYLRERMRGAEELIVNQHARFQSLNEQLKTRIEESTRIINQMNKLQNALVEAEKLASVGRLSATLAHEIRNPLSIIKSSTEIVLDDVAPRSGGASAISLIREEIERMDRIITDLLNFSRPKTAQLSSHPLKSLVRHWLPPVVEELEKHRIQLVPQLEDYDAEVLVDADQLYQVFLNMMWNARDALIGHPNPHIFVRTEEGSDGFARLTIQDTGPGMIPETLQQIKEPFFTTKTKGTGLGIPVSVQLMEGMGGRINWTSELEVGTTVTIHLRLAPRKSPAQHLAEAGMANATRPAEPPPVVIPSATRP